MSLFLDSWFWIALFDARDTGHASADRLIRDALLTGEELVTTDYVLDESITLLCRRAGPVNPIKPLRALVDFLESADILRERISPVRFAEALRLRFRFHDKPEISFTDLTSMVVMQELRIRDIVTRDRDFLKVNMGFRLRWAEV
ncbi:MAG: PIN domain-containing protein [Candidatus Sumerlaeia bacterium]|nr:PIN domain-containing protein [Candidatus Sumerlaeia bacterium]